MLRADRRRCDLLRPGNADECARRKALAVSARGGRKRRPLTRGGAQNGFGLYKAKVCSSGEVARAMSVLLNLAPVWF